MAPFFFPVLQKRVFNSPNPDRADPTQTEEQNFNNSRPGDGLILGPGPKSWSKTQTGPVWTDYRPIYIIFLFLYEIQ